MMLSIENPFLPEVGVCDDAEEVIFGECDEDGAEEVTTVEEIGEDNGGENFGEIDRGDEGMGEDLF